MLKGGKLIITGGAGFVGTNLVKELISLGGKVLVVDNLSTGKLENVPSKAFFCKEDILNPTQLLEIFKDFKPAVVFHLAAQVNVRDSFRNPEFTFKVNVEGTENVLKASIASEAKKFIFISTGGALYGDRAPIPTPEDFSPSPQSPYGKSKLEAEKLLNSFKDKIDIIILRPSNIYGPYFNPESNTGVIGIFISKIFKKEPLEVYGGEQTRDLIYVKDVVKACIKTLNLNQYEVFNISSGKETKIKEVLEIIKKKVKLVPKISFLPLVEKEQLRSCLDNTKAKNLLDWRPEVNLEEGIDLTVKWFLKNYG